MQAIRFSIIFSLSLLALTQLNADEQSDNQAIRKAIAQDALKYIDTPYSYGGATPKGFDCSGFIFFLYGQYIKNLPRRSSDYLSYGKKIELSQLQVGDLLLFATMPGSEKITHVSIYLGQGKVIHAISDGKLTGIQISNMSKGYWRKHLRAARSILP